MFLLALNAWKLSFLFIIIIIIFDCYYVCLLGLQMSFEVHPS